MTEKELQKVLCNIVEESTKNIIIKIIKESKTINEVCMYCVPFISFNRIFGLPQTEKSITKYLRRLLSKEPEVLNILKKLK